MRDKKGNMVRNAHLKGLFARICKLLFFGVKYVQTYVLLSTRGTKQSKQSFQELFQLFPC
jgi:hypothetical protein